MDAAVQDIWGLAMPSSETLLDATSLNMFQNSLLSKVGIFDMFRNSLLSKADNFDANVTTVEDIVEARHVPLTAVWTMAIGAAAMFVQIMRIIYMRRCDSAKPKRDAGLWVIAGSVYDIHPYMDRHPGGRYMLEAARGRDCTALFHSYHAISTKPIKKMLEKHYVRKAREDECVDSKIWDWNGT